MNSFVDLRMREALVGANMSELGALSVAWGLSNEQVEKVRIWAEARIRAAFDEGLSRGLRPR